MSDTFFKVYDSATTEEIIASASGLAPVIKYFHVNAVNATDVTTLRNGVSSGTLLEIIGDDDIGPNLTERGVQDEGVEITAPSGARVTVDYLHVGYRVNGQGHPFGTVDYRGS